MAQWTEDEIQRKLNLHAQWLEDNSQGERLEIHGDELKGVNMPRGANLSHANLRDADLTSAFLQEVNLTDAELQGADLTGADLRKATLDGADFTKTQLWNTSLSREHLESDAVDLTGAYNLRNAALHSFNGSKTKVQVSQGIIAAHCRLHSDEAEPAALEA